MIEIIMSAFGIITSFQLIPSCYRIYKRKSSKDFSLWTIYIGLICQATWLFYAIYENILCMKVAGIAWLLLMFIQLILVLRYRKIKSFVLSNLDFQEMVD